MYYPLGRVLLPLAVLSDFDKMTHLFCGYDFGLDKLSTL